MTDPKQQTTIHCYKCGQLLLDQLAERAIAELHTAAKNHACPTDQPPDTPEVS